MFYELIILDLDGVVADQRRAATGVLNYLAAEGGLAPVPASAIDRLEDRTAAGLAGLLPLPPWRRHYLAYRLGRLLGTCTGAIGLHAGVDEAIRRLRAQDVPVAVVSRWTTSAVRDVLGDDLAGAIRHIEPGHPWGGRSRQLARVLAACRMRAHRALYVGDLGADGETARLLGINFGAVAWGRTSLERLLETVPDEVFRRPADLGRLAAPCQWAGPASSPPGPARRAA